MIEAEQIIAHIQGSIDGAEVYVKDLTGGKDHYELFVVSDAFKETNRVKCHQMVMGALAEPLKGPLHAVTIKTFTKEQWDKLGE